MRIAAGLVGILVGIFSVTYVGLFGGMLGSATSWLGSGPWAHGDSSVSNLGQLISFLSYLSGLLAIVGGIVAFSNTRIGGIILAGSAFSHWYLLGFGVIGKVFILPIAAAAAFAFFAAPSKLKLEPSGWATSPSVQDSGGIRSEGASFDQAKWNALVQYDKDIAAIAERLQPLGQKWIDEFASSYLALNDKQYLPDIEQKIVAGAKAEAADDEQRRIRAEERCKACEQGAAEQRRVYEREQERLAEAHRKQFELWRDRIWGTTPRRIATLASALVVALIVTVALWPKTYRDPFEYCQAFGTVDYPAKEVRYKGPSYTQEMLKVTGVDSANQVVWRCMNKQVLACAEIGTTACGRAPWLEPSKWPIPQEVAQECMQHPNTECVGATHCIWGCRGTTPVLDRMTYPVDVRGFEPKEWRVVSNP